MASLRAKSIFLPFLDNQGLSSAEGTTTSRAGPQRSNFHGAVADRLCGNRVQDRPVGRRVEEVGGTGSGSPPRPGEGQPSGSSGRACSRRCRLIPIPTSTASDASGA